jgi:UDP-galactopyranose mutase
MDNWREWRSPVSAAAFIAACKRLLRLSKRGPWLNAVDRKLASMSWDKTFFEMHRLRSSTLLNKLKAGMPDAQYNPKLRTGIPSIVTSKLKPYYDVLIIGAGFARSVMAERFATQSKKRVLLVESRTHIGGMLTMNTMRRVS